MAQTAIGERGAARFMGNWPICTICISLPWTFFSPLTCEEGFGARGFFLVSRSKHGHLVSGISRCWSVFMKAVEVRTTLT